MATMVSSVRNWSRICRSIRISGASGGTSAWPSVRIVRRKTPGMTAREMAVAATMTSHGRRMEYRYSQPIQIPLETSNAIVHVRDRLAIKTARGIADVLATVDGQGT